MRIESALYASKQGIDAHGKAISVIGDNISNSNTVGFKSSRVEFADLLGTGEEGGEPSTIPSTGSGVELARVRPIHSNGVIEFSGRTLDMAIQGNGFFMIGDAAAPTLSRAGNFEISSDGLLVNVDGNAVLGLSGVDGATLGPIDMVNLDLTGQATTAANLTGNLSAGEQVTAVPEGADSFLDLGGAASFSATVTAFDSLGGERNVSMYFFKTGANEWTVNAYANGSDVGGEDGVPVAIGTSNIQFNTDGTINPDGGATTIELQAPWAGAAEGAISIDLTGFSQFASPSNLSGLTVDGQAAGSINGYQIDPDGAIYATLNTGNRAFVGQLQLANVRNVDGLERVGNSAFRETDRSGERVIGAPGSTGLGGIEAASLERSTVDISTEFVELVLYQRGYQANSQIMNAASDIIRDTIGLVR